MRKIALLPLLFVVVACSGKVSIGSNGSTSGNLKKNPDGSSTGNGQTCSYGGSTANVGDRFTAPDGCNTCTCAAEGAYCTEMACVDGGAADVCNYGNKVYKEGDTFPSTDGCNSCSCNEGGQVGCTLMACAIDAGPAVCNSCADPAPGIPSIQCFDGTVAGPSCEDTGNGCGWIIKDCKCASSPTHQPGDTWQEACSSCACGRNGDVLCTASACTCPADGTINCMPPVTSSKQAVCGGTYHQWVTQNCPKVKFVF